MEDLEDAAAVHGEQRLAEASARTKGRQPSRKRVCGARSSCCRQCGRQGWLAGAEARALGGGGGGGGDVVRGRPCLASLSGPFGGLLHPTETNLGRQAGCPPLPSRSLAAWLPLAAPRKFLLFVARSRETTTDLSVSHTNWPAMFEALCFVARRYGWLASFLFLILAEVLLPRKWVLARAKVIEQLIC